MNGNERQIQALEALETALGLSPVGLTLDHVPLADRHQNALALARALEDQTKLVKVLAKKVLDFLPKTN